MSALRNALRNLPDDVFFDLLESEEAYLVVIDVPGVSADSVEVDVDGNTISIDARHEKELPDDYHYVEENRQMLRDVTIPLPRGIDLESIETTVGRGVLKLALPKERAATEIDVVEDESV